MYSIFFLLSCVSYTACHKNVHPLIRFEDNYNSKVMPLKFLPLNVNLTIHITNVYEIDNVYQLLGLETTVQMNWIDERIKLLDIPVEHLISDRITLPPPFRTMSKKNQFFSFDCSPKCSKMCINA